MGTDKFIITYFKVQADQTWNKFFFVNSDNQGIRICEKKFLNYNKN